MKTFPSIALLIALSSGLTFAMAQSSNGAGPAQTQAPAQQQNFPANYHPASPVIYTSSLGSSYVPMDSWVYPALDRLYSIGYLDTAFMGMRPWTRLSIAHMLQQTADKIDANPNDDEARELYLALEDEFTNDQTGPSAPRAAHMEVDSVYSLLRGITNTPLNDSFHLGQTIVNDYGRPYQAGFNNYTGFSARAEAGRFSLYFRGEYQHAPAAEGYTLAQAMALSNIDLIPFASNPVQDTIPLGPIATTNDFRVMEASISYHLLGHEISFGKNDQWLSPAKGGAMSWSTNAEAPYTFEINRVEPLRVPLLSRLTGPFRYEFFVGSLKGHSYPNSPWVHMEKVSFKPTHDLEFGFERTVIWGGKGHGCLAPGTTNTIIPCDEPITLHTFLKSFFSLQNVSFAEKFSRDDPGARFGSFDFDYRLPFLRHWITLYTDSEAHDDVNPISAPRRSGVRPGIYLSRVPGLQHLDLRVEGVSTDPVSDADGNGNFLYYETIQRQGTTNKGYMFSEAIGRDAKGGQAWITYHLSPTEFAQFSYRDVKVDQKFIPSGTTQNDYQFAIQKRFMKDFEARGWVQAERWVAPFYKPGVQHDTTIQAQVTWFPKLEK